ncbi:sulfotransferase-like domain-containing protein [Thalassobius sp. S69A]|uniref:sulfotransferase-like domain-containing protein n=1 Tax=unclassified Thalassovita TaxID=2619711 RepID=UPI000C0D6540|nr:sulfotransferase family protein [Paracoccaceae bacterium]MBT26536.1 sulfotransferase family protein [Paracoccaceae bacterium]
MRIAMWSGPRNLSTAMMYSFGARPDCAVLDEPFYGPYLRLTGLDHPMREEILASRPEGAEEVVAQILGSVPAQKPHFYQKHMTQHMVLGMPRDWMAEVTNVFLIRHPARVIASFGAKWDGFRLSDIGFTQQTELFEYCRALGQNPVVVDSSDIRRDPEGMLRKLCAAIGLEFDPAMLSWPRGGHPTDGVWAAHWYGAVHSSTGFAPAEGELPALEGVAADLLAEAWPHYERLARVKI